LGIGGVHPMPAPKPVVEGVAALKPKLIRIFLQEFFYQLINATTCFGLKFFAIFRELINLLACAAYASTYVVGILHTIKSVTMKIKCHDS
jgi:hypothetical protein